ncbi:RNA-binding S4 domain-containing protein [Alkalibacter rhizosphaerae]|uniref:RNA-binding S4 domain-containing protein n=1 Tax=Alkalibacter rhizosphaerae TaxID=2815577 RepID=A0A975AH32_9FIRM|nr:RNA-binding S4 domain-containing protein [Alkalibacter rhizosphaerae]QSX07583.1 RNA-binding S4 domain-containing protein [Alkalibacter rhizosphaerae]
MNEVIVAIETEYIKLDQFLKFAGVADSGSYAKMMIQQEDVLVNGQVCLQRGKKLRPGDRVEISGLDETFLVAAEE